MASSVYNFVHNHLEQLVFNLEGNADWRERIAEKFANDKDRNLKAAEIARKIAQDIKTQESAKITRANFLISEMVRKDFDVNEQVEFQNSVCKQVGFSIFDTESFLDVIISEYERLLNQR